MTTQTNLPPKPVRKRYTLELGIAIAGVLGMNAIFLAPAFRGSEVEPTAAGQLGDFVGGYVGTLFGLLSVLLLVHTLRAQRASTTQQNFESKYFTLLQLHRENLNEFQLGKATGRKVFVLMLREFREVVPHVKAVAAKHGKTFSPQQTIHIAYYSFFYGTGPNASRMLKAALAEFGAEFADDLNAVLDRKDIKSRIEASRELGYTPFEGHQSRLGHYYRHLYQTIRYIDQQNPVMDRYDFAKTVRAQLSTHEQALLFLNSMTPLGRDWWRKGFILKYRMVQNLPRDFFDRTTELDVPALFPNGYFEWEDGQDSGAGKEGYPSNMRNEAV
jgi:hypothetical protein